MWYVLFVMMQYNGEETQQTYQVVEPEFETIEECIRYVAEGETNAILKDHILTIYPLRPVEKVFCVNQDAIDQLFGTSIQENDNGLD